ncbi:GNAT family N-acetyltransferase [Hymenobacter arizonensis]|uniref:Protein N-acetyltransferase, RimJ/RimL family n=1 Tax=Hymenobacter arizonensis TaxID=1227077 RepID=A0A1I5UJC8_HYMAR|nr:GNAT family protein [Hymenobacter arizonensis]SFP95393.1 Protein N-acetyltransferase, RimJ/RimL family [Hymenobacter arizonensis]
MITLVPLLPENVVCFYRWLRDKQVIEYSMSVFATLRTEEDIDHWYAATLQDKKSINLGIYLQETNELIGYAGISSLSQVNQSGEYFILLGEKAYWGRGIGTEVTRQVLALGFAVHGLNRIMLTVSEPNVGGLKAYAKAGFVVEGRLRKACFRNKEFHDKILMSVLQSEWQSQLAAAGLTVPG